jgi:hypothetical protein
MSADCANSNLNTHVNSYLNAHVNTYAYAYTDPDANQDANTYAYAYTDPDPIATGAYECAMYGSYAGNTAQAICRSI